jgi:capsid protein
MILKSLKQIFKRPKAKSSAWDAAASGRRLHYWQPGNDSINPLLLQHMDSLRNRSRDMVRKNPYAANIVDTLVANCIGTGIKPQSKALDADFRKQVQGFN